MTAEALRQWAASLSSCHLPRWQELPQLELYMDQVLEFLEASLAGLAPPGQKFITAAMINNYVKQGILPKPHKKKYGRPHVSRLIVITLAKQTTSLADIGAALDFMMEEQDGAAMYDALCSRVEAALLDTGKAILSGLGEHELLLALSGQAISSGLAVTQLIAMHHNAG